MTVRKLLVLTCPACELERKELVALHAVLISKNPIAPIGTPKLELLKPIYWRFKCRQCGWTEVHDKRPTETA